MPNFKVTGSGGVGVQKLVSFDTQTGKLDSPLKGLVKGKSKKGTPAPELRKTDLSGMKQKLQNIKAPPKPTTTPTTTPTVAPKTVATPKSTQEMAAALLTLQNSQKQDGAIGTAFEKVRGYQEAAKGGTLTPSQYGEVISLLSDINAALGKLDKGDAGPLSDVNVATLRQQLAEMAVKIALPQLRLEPTAPQTVHPDQGKLDDQIKGLAENLLQMRDAVKGDAAAIVTGDFLTSLSSSPYMGKDFGPKRDGAAGVLDKAETLKLAVKGMMHGQMGAVLLNVVDQQVPNVATLLKELRKHSVLMAAQQTFLAQLPEKERKQMVSANPNLDLKTISPSEFRACLPDSLRNTFDHHMENAGKTATARNEFEEQRTRLSWVIEPKGMVEVEAAILMQLRGARKISETNSGNVVNQDMRASDSDLKAVIGKIAKDNKEGAFQIVRLALAMQKLSEAEKKSQGIDQFTLPDGAKLTTQQLMDVAGITDADVKKMGYVIDKDKDDFQLNLERLGKAGFEGTDQVVSTMDKMRGFKGVIENSDIQSNLKNQVNRQLEASGTLLHEELKLDLLTLVPKEILQKKDLTPQMVLTQSYQAVTEMVDKSLLQDKDGNPSDAVKDLDRLQTSLLRVHKAQQKVNSQIVAVEKSMSEARGVLADYKKTHGKIDLKDPAGLRSAKLILEAIDLEKSKASSSPSDIQKADAQIQLILQQLKGFDVDTLHRKTFGGKPPTFDQIKDLGDQARAIVTLRETGPEKLERLRSNQTMNAAAQKELLAQRRAINPQLMDAITRVVHAAVLTKTDFSKLATSIDGVNNPSIDNSSKRDEIYALLKDWGLPTDHFEAEIEMAVGTPMTSSTLKSWRSQDGRGTMAEIFGLATPEKSSRTAREVLRDLTVGGLRFLANKTAIDDEMRRELSALVTTMKPSAKYDLTAGVEVTANSGRIPLDPSGTVTVRARLAGSVFKNVIIETGSKGELKFTAVLGAGVKLGGDVMAGWKLAEGDVGTAKIDLKAGVELSGDVNYEHARGFQITFPPGEAGKQAAIDMLMKMTEKQRPSAQVLENLSEVAAFKRHKGGVQGKVEGSLKFSIGKESADDGLVFGSDTDDKNRKSGASNKQGFGAQLGIGAGGSIGGKSETMSSLGKETVKSEWQTNVNLFVNFKVWAQVFTATGLAMNQIINRSGIQSEMDEMTVEKGANSRYDGGNATTGIDVVNVGAEMSVTQVHKKKFEFETLGKEQRQVLTKGEWKEVTDGAGTGAIIDLLTKRGEDIKAKVQSDPTFKTKLTEILSEISKPSGSGRNVEITYNLKPEIVNKINAFNRQADLAHDNKDKINMALYKAAAEELLNDPASYKPAKIVLLEKTSSKDSVNRGTAVLVKMDLTSQTGVERVLMSLDM